jgi:U3 small nucleolar RNA-associated protein 5
MSTKGKTPAKIAQPIVRQSAKKPLKSRINESETIVAVPEVSNLDNAAATDAIIEISSNGESSEYELSDDDHDHAHEDNTQEDTKSGIQRATEPSFPKHSDDTSPDIDMAEANILNDAESDQELAQPTLGELARAHGTIDVPSALAPQPNSLATRGRSIAAPSHSSLGTVLSQALRTDDVDLLESCLRVQDVETIDNTIQRLDSTLAGILLGKLASRMHRRPGRAGILMVWVQSTLVCHGGALAAQPGLVKRLKELQRVLDERAKGLNSLLALKGKLELMNAQLRLRRQQRNSEVDEDTEEAEEGIIYVEGEDSDADMANGLMDLDDDELPVTSGIMDDESDDDDLPSDASEGEEELDVEEELDEDEVDHEDVESDEEDSEAEAAPQQLAKRSRTSKGR